MSTFTEACKTGWEIYRGETSVDKIAKDYFMEKLDSFTSPVHRIPDRIRFKHLIATGETGCGKSSFLKGLMAKDIPLCLQKKRTLIYIDPVTGIDELVNETNIGHRENVFLIDFSDPDSLPRLNLFETGIERKGMLATTHMVNTFKSVCTGLLDQELTPPMAVFFGYCGRVMANVKDRTLHDLLNLLDHPTDFMDEVGMDQNDPVYRFFVDDVLSKGSKFMETSKYLRMRVHGFLNNEIIEQLLINKKPTLKLGKVIEKGSILLIATRKSDIGQDGCRLTGKYIKAIVNRIVQERVHAPSIDNCVPIMFYEDEFQNSLDKGYDDQLATMLDENRKFKLSVNLATTRFGHINTDMADAIMTCCANKITGKMASRGAGFVAGDIGRTAQELKDLPEYHLYVKSGAKMKKAVEVISPKNPFKKFRTNKKSMKTLQNQMNIRFGERYVKSRPTTEARQSTIEDVEM